MCLARRAIERSALVNSENDPFAQLDRRAITGASVVDLLDESRFEDEVTAAPFAVFEMLLHDRHVGVRELFVEVLVETLEAVVAVHHVL